MTSVPVSAQTVSDNDPTEAATEERQTGEKGDNTEQASIEATLKEAEKNAEEAAETEAETAGETKTSGEFTYKVNEDGKSVTIVRIETNKKEVTIPAELDNISVTAVDGDEGGGEPNAVIGRTVESVIIEDGIRAIGAYCFNLKKYRFARYTGRNRRLCIF